MAEISTRAVATAAAGAVLAVGLAWVSPADATHQYDETVRCGTKTVRNVQPVAGNRDAVLFRKMKGTRSNVNATAYACLRRRGPIVNLGQAGFVKEAQFAGRYLGFRRINYVGEHGSASGIAVVDLRLGTSKVEERGVPGANDVDSHALSFVVKRNGSVAWIGDDDAGPDYTVWKVDMTDDGPQRLDIGPEIDYRSLRLSADRRTVTWVNGGQQRAAPLN